MAADLLIDGRKRGVERFHRSGRRLWVYQQYAPDDAVTLETIGFTCPFADLYEGTGL